MLSLFKRRPTTPHFSEILLDEDAFRDGARPADAVQDMVDYINALIHGALFKNTEIPQEAYQLYCADIYIAQVENGGHSQFLANGPAHSPDRDVLALALAGLKMINCTEIADCLADLINWARANPEEAQRQNGFTQRADALEQLDKRIFDIGTDRYSTASHDWLRDSPLVRKMSAEAFTTALTSAKDKNPRYTSRRRTNTIHALDAGLTTDTAALYRACAAGVRARGAMFEVRQITGGNPQGHPAQGRPDFDFARPESQVWRINTNTEGPMFGFIHDGMVHLAVKDEHGALHSIIERPLGQVEEHLKRAGESKPGRYALSLMNALVPDDEPAFLMFENTHIQKGVTKNNPMFYGIVGTSGAQYAMLVQDNGATLERCADDTLLGHVNGKDFATLQGEDHSKLH